MHSDLERPEGECFFSLAFFTFHATIIQTWQKITSLKCVIKFGTRRAADPVPKMSRQKCERKNIIIYYYYIIRFICYYLSRYLYIKKTTRPEDLAALYVMPTIKY